jgi:hypothetical protein
MVQAGVHYGLRARAAFSSRRLRGSLDAEDLHQPAAAATVSVGLRPGRMTISELRRFPKQQKEYLHARFILALLDMLLTMKTVAPSAGGLCSYSFQATQVFWFRFFQHVREECYCLLQGFNSAEMGRGCN